MKRCGADALVIHHKLAHPALRARLRRSDKSLYVWLSMEDEFIDSHERDVAYRRAAALGPAGLIVGRVAEARAAISLPRAHSS